MTLSLAPGPLIADVGGLTLTDTDRKRLCHPAVGGVILFARNYHDRAQLTALTAEIHALRSPALLIAIDHEGGRVQRCRDGFTRLPAMQALGRCMRVATISDVVQEIIFFNGTIAAKHVAPKLMKKVKAIAKIASASDDLVSVLEAAVLKEAPADELVAEVVDDTASEVDDAAWDGDDD